MRIAALERYLKYTLSCTLFGVVSYCLFLSIRCDPRDCYRQDERPLGKGSNSKPPIPLRPMLETTEPELHTTKSVIPVADTSGSDRLIWSSAEEIAYPLAFSQYIYDADPRAVRLFRLIYRPQNVYCINLKFSMEDAILNNFRRGIADLLDQTGGDNVIFIPKHQRTDYSWSYYQFLNNTLVCMRALLNYTHINWRYYFNLWDRSLPLRTNWEIVRALKAMNGSNSVENYGIPPYWIPPTAASSIKFKWIKGSEAVGLSREFVHFIFTDSVAKELDRVVANSGYVNAEEIFFHTLVHNPQYGAPGACLDSRSTDPGNSRTWHMAQYYYKNKLECKTGKFCLTACCLGIMDLPELMTRPEFFANLFRYHIEPEAYDFIERWVIAKTRLERINNRLDSSFNVTYYAELYCSKSHL